MNETIKQKAISGLFWSFFERIGQQGIQFIIAIILARLLLPEQFGLIAMLTIFMSVAQSIIDSGFGSALIQKQDANPYRRRRHFDVAPYRLFLLGVNLGLVEVITPDGSLDYAGLKRIRRELF